MNKAVMILIQPYYVFLIIARKMGWDIPQEKRIEVRKNFPKDPKWNKYVHIYCSKNRKSFNCIPKQYQPLMKKFLGKVIGEFVYDKIDKYRGRLTTFTETPYKNKYVSPEELAKTCLSIYEINDYLNNRNACFWHISELVIYDKPKELGEFNGFKKCIACKVSGYEVSACIHDEKCMIPVPLTRPFQSWGYVCSNE